MKIKCENDKCGKEVEVVLAKMYGGIDAKFRFFCCAECCLEKIFGIRPDKKDK